ncbi:MAG: hypothetical protein OHK0015_28310 [Chloroflexi bacterium OHK40]
MEQPRSYRSFLVRLWLEPDVDGHDRWCGEVEQIQSGHRCGFPWFDDLMTLLRPGTGADSWPAPDPAHEPPVSTYTR